MPEPFDPYYKWLGIPPSQQPPHHYRLLGIELYEADPEVIDRAAGQRMSYLQELSGGEHVKESQRLLNEVSTARRCLLDKARKAEYDAALRAKLAPAGGKSERPTVVVASRAVDEDDTINVSPTVRGGGGRPPAAKRTEPPIVIDVGAKTASSAGPRQSGDAKSSATAAPARTASRKKKKKPLIPLAALALVAVGGVAGVGYVVQNRKSPLDEQAEIAAIYERDVAARARREAEDRAEAERSAKAEAEAIQELAKAAPVAVPPAAGTSSVAAPTATATSTAARTPAPPAAKASTTVLAARSSITPSTAPAPQAEFLTAAQAAAAAGDKRLHFTPQRNALGGLRAFFRSGDEYHLFYQAAPLPRRANAEPWGHVVSRDLITWREAPLKSPFDPKAPPELGSVFVDTTGALGVGKAGRETWFAAYAAPPANARRAELRLAYSLDAGATWTVHKTKPALEGYELTTDACWPRIVRDTKRGIWRMLLQTRPGGKTDDASVYTLFTSTDLKTWTKRQDVRVQQGGGPAEYCELSAPGGDRRWVLLTENGRCMVGTFDGELFKSSISGTAIQLGRGYYGFRLLDDPTQKRALLTAVVAADQQHSHGAALALPRITAPAGQGLAWGAEVAAAVCSAAPQSSIKQDLTAGPKIEIGADRCGESFRFSLHAELDSKGMLELTLFGAKHRFDCKNQLQKAPGIEEKFLGTTVRLEGVVDRDIVEISIPEVGAMAYRSDFAPGAVPLVIDALYRTARDVELKITPLRKPAAPAAKTGPK